MFEMTPFYRTNPFNNFYSPFRAMEEIEKSFFGQQLPEIRTDIKKLDDSYILEAELPGFEKEDISLQIKDGVLTVSAKHEAKKQSEDSNTGYIRKERYEGSFTRRFDLDGIDEEAITAEYKSGILTVNLPVKEKKDDTRTIEIK